MIRGVVIKVPDTTPGLLVAGGQQYPFSLAGIWQGEAAPVPNQKVEFSLHDDGSVKAIHVPGRDVMATEALNDFGKQIGGQVLPYLHMQKEKMSAPGVGLAVLLFGAFFFLPGWKLDGLNTLIGFDLSFTLDQLLGFQMSIAGPASNITVWRLLGMVIILLPWIAPWLSFRRAFLLNGAPLVFLVGLSLFVRWKIHQFARSAASASGHTFGAFGATVDFQHDMQAMAQKQIDLVLDATSWVSGYWIALLAAAGLAGLTYVRRHSW